MALNALRRDEPLGQQDELVTPAGLLAELNHPAIRRAVGPGGQGFTLDELAVLACRAIPRYLNDPHEVELIRIAQADDTTHERVRRILRQNERSHRDLVLAQFEQGVFTGDPERKEGHIAPVAAFDSMKDRVLILDPDRRWYEPYWIPLTTFVAGLATLDPITQQPRGLVHIRRK